MSNKIILKNYNIQKKSVKKLIRKSKDIDPDLDMRDLCLNDDEVRHSEELIRKYTKEFIIENKSDKELLKQIILYEVIHKRLADQINAIERINAKAGGRLASGNLDKTLNMMHRNTEAVIKLKGLLGLLKDAKANEDSKSAFLSFKKKANALLNANQASRYFRCGHCAKENLIRVRPDKWEQNMSKHPFFRDRVLGNEKLMELYLIGFTVDCPHCKEKHTVRLTEEHLKKIFEVGDEYCEWLIERWKLNEKLIKKTPSEYTAKVSQELVTKILKKSKEEKKVVVKKIQKKRK